MSTEEAQYRAGYKDGKAGLPAWRDRPFAYYAGHAAGTNAADEIYNMGGIYRSDDETY